MMQLLLRIHWRDWSLATKLGVLFVSMAIVPLMLVTFYNDIVHRDELLAAARQRNLTEAQDIAEEMEGYIVDTLADIQMLSLMPSSARYLRAPDDLVARDEIRLLLYDMREIHRYDALYLTDQSDKVLLATDPRMTGRSYITASWYRNAIAGQMAFSEPLYDANDNHVFVHFSAPVRGMDGVIHGTIIGRIGVEQLDRLVSDAANFSSHSDFGMLWNDLGIVLSNSDDPSVRFVPLAPLAPDVTSRLGASNVFGTNTRDLLQHMPIAPDLLERSKLLLYDSKTNPQVETNLGRNGSVIGALTPMQSTRWVIGVFTPQAMLLEELNDQTNRAFETAALMIVMAILVALLAARWTMRPILRVVEATNALASGDMTNRLAMPQRDEVGKLAGSFNALADALVEKEKQLHAYTDELGSRVQARTQELRESEERWKFALEGSAEGVWDWNVQTGEMFYSPYYSEMLGYTKEELANDQVLWHDRVPVQDQERLNDALNQHLAGKSPVYIAEYRVLAKDGTYRWILARGKVMSRTADGKPLRMVGTHSDITARYRAEEEIRRRIAYQSALNAVIVSAVNANTDLQAILDGALEQTLQALGLDIGVVWTIGATAATHAVAIRGLPSEFNFSAIQTTRDKPFDLDGPLAVSDWRQVESPLQPLFLRHAIRASLTMPLMVDGKRIGALSVAATQPREWNAEEIAFIESIGYQLGIVAERVRTLQQARARAEQLETLYQVGLKLGRIVDQHDQLQLFVETARKTLNADQATIFLFDPDTGSLNFETGTGENLDAARAREWRVQIGEERGILGLVAQKRQAFYLADVSTDSRWIAWDPNVRSALWAPVLYEDQLRGVLVYTCIQINAFTLEDEQLALLLSNQIAVAMENSRLYKSAVDAADRRAILHRTSQEVIAAGTDLERVYAAAHRAASELMQCNTFVVVLHHPESLENEAVYLSDTDGRHPGFRMAQDKGISGRVILSGNSLLINEYPDHITQSVTFGNPTRVRSILAVPLHIGDQTIGMLSAQSYQLHAYTPEDQVLLEMLAANVAAVIENARLFGETGRRLAVLESISRMSTSLRTVQTLTEMLTVLLDETLKMLDADSATVWMYDAHNAKLVQVAARGFPADLAPVKSGEGIAGQVFASGEVYLSRDFKNDPRTVNDNRTHVPDGLSGAAVPIRTARESIGVLFVSVKQAEVLTEDRVYILTTLAELAGNAIHRQRLHNQTQQRLEQVQALRTVDMAITSSMDLNVTLSILLEHVIAQLGVSAGDVLLFNPHARVLDYRIGRGMPMRRQERGQLRLGEGLAGVAARERRLIAISDTHAENLGHPAALAASYSTDGFAAYFCIPLVAKGALKGVLELFHRAPLYPDGEWHSFLETVANQAAIAIDNAQLFDDLQRSNVELALAYDTTIEGWSRTLDLRDEETHGHTQRVTDLTVRLAREMGFDEAELVNVRRGALLHDIGKMGVPDKILLKPGPLTPEEWVQMRKHPEYAYQVLMPIAFLRHSLDIPYCHHESWDGSGYPRGLRGEQIPLSARIFAIVDVWDALTSNRPYRTAWSEKKTREYLLSMSDKQFDPRVVETFLRMMPEE